MAEYSGLTKTSTALSRLSSKRTILCCYGYCQVSVMLEFRETYESSFPRTRESRP
ncbi:TPA: hypothetical protein WI075_001581 [Neisseria meningitidis]|nr:hypothetical protein [Neisseria meningitidis]MBH6217267.1 hypothetical protein [Neisseria meningitidis]MBH6233723.1 hypothetical protein [Neisseria meningitidis]MBH6733895.1 hypothetical protein [Neisseria meningitidis]